MRVSGLQQEVPRVRLQDHDPRVAAGGLQDADPHARLADRGLQDPGVMAGPLTAYRSAGGQEELTG